MKIHEYNEMMAYLTRPGKAQGGVIGEGGMFQGEDMGYRTGYSSLLPKVIEHGPKVPKYVRKGTSIIQKAMDAAKKYGVKYSDWVKASKSEKQATAYDYRSRLEGTTKRTADTYVSIPDEPLVRIEPTEEILAMSEADLISAAKKRSDMNTPEYWAKLEVLGKKTGSSVANLQKDLNISIANPLRERFNTENISMMFPSAKSTSRIKDFEKIFEIENKVPMAVTPQRTKLKSYQENPDLWTKRMELIKSKGFDMDKLYTEGELKVLLNSPGFSFKLVESAMPEAIKRIGPKIAKKGQPGGVKQGLVSLNDINSIFLNKISTPTKHPRAIGMSYIEAQKATDEGLYKMAVESFRKVLSNKIKVNANTGVIEAFTTGSKLNPEITSILQKYDVKVPQIAHLNPVMFAKRTVSAAKDITVPKAEL